jgi:hypothetical protein
MATTSKVSNLIKKATPAAAIPKKKGFPARKPGTPVVKRAPSKPLPKFKAPADYKPAFYEVVVGIGKDGLIDPRQYRVTRIAGKLDNPAAKRNDMSEFDTTTMFGIISRLSSIMFITNLEKRLECFPAGARFRITVRVSKRAADGSLAATVKLLHRITKEGKWRLMDDKTDPTYRRIRRVARILPSAFVDAQLPPKAIRGAKKEEDAPVVTRKRTAANDEPEIQVKKRRAA